VSFEERLNEMLERVLNEKETFNQQWGDKRRGVVVPRLQLAETQLRKKLGNAQQVPKSGTVTLYVRYAGNETYLRFVGNDERLEIGYWLETYPKDNEEPVPGEPTYLALVEVTEDKIEEIIMDFAAMAARGGRRLKPA